MPIDATVDVRDAKEVELKTAMRAASGLTLPHPPHDPEGIVARALAELHARVTALEQRLAEVEKR